VIEAIIKGREGFLYFLKKVGHYLNAHNAVHDIWSGILIRTLA